MCAAAYLLDLDEDAHCEPSQENGQKDEKRVARARVVNLPLLFDIFTRFFELQKHHQNSEEEILTSALNVAGGTGEEKDEPQQEEYAREPKQKDECGFKLAKNHIQKQGDRRPTDNDEGRFEVA